MFTETMLAKGDGNIEMQLAISHAGRYVSQDESFFSSEGDIRLEGKRDNFPESNIVGNEMESIESRESYSQHMPLKRQETFKSSKIYQPSRPHSDKILTPEDVLLEAQRELDKARSHMTAYAISEERTRRIVQEVIAASKERDSLKSRLEISEKDISTNSTFVKSEKVLKSKSTSAELVSQDSIDLNNFRQAKFMDSNERLGNRTDKRLKVMTLKSSRSSFRVNLSNLIDNTENCDEQLSHIDDGSQHQHQMIQEDQDREELDPKTGIFCDSFWGCIPSRTIENRKSKTSAGKSSSHFSRPPINCSEIRISNGLCQHDQNELSETLDRNSVVVSKSEMSHKKVLPRDLTTGSTSKNLRKCQFIDSCSTTSQSRTIIVHQVIRGNWTWCTAWSPDGKYLAIATEKQHLAIIDTFSSTVWRFRHDRRITNPHGTNPVHSIQAIAWGGQFIALGGNSSNITILSPIDPYPIVHTIKGTGSVSSLDWRFNSPILAMGSRDVNKCSVYKVSIVEDNIGGDIGTIQRIVSQELYSIKRAGWVNVVKFSLGGSHLAIGDKTGKLSVYLFQAPYRQQPKLEKTTSFLLKASVMDAEWSSDGLWLYAGMEDFTIIVIDTLNWRIAKRITRNHDVHFVSSSSQGSHVAVGGGTSEISFLNVHEGWKSAGSIELNDFIPFSAKWHPSDKFLVLNGQSNSAFAIETTRSRNCEGNLQMIAPISSVEFSPSGNILAVSNEAGVVSFFRSEEGLYIPTFELLLSEDCSSLIAWSPNDIYVLISKKDTISIFNNLSKSETENKLPPNTFGLWMRKEINEVSKISSISIHVSSRYVAIAGKSLIILDAENDFKAVREFELESSRACSWSSDGSWLAATGKGSKIFIFDTGSISVSSWKLVFTLDCDEPANALAWGPAVVDGLQYLAYGGESQRVTIIEIRTFEGTWENVLKVIRNAAITALDWSLSGLLAAAVANGTVTIIDLAYLKSGCAINEMDYKWQRQSISCFTEIRENSAKHEVRSIRWIPSQRSSQSCLAIGRSNGAFEVIDLTGPSEKNDCDIVSS
jgi:WD40-like Beta Propeller Repeat